MKHSIICSAFLIILAATGCRKANPIDIAIPGGEKQLVISSAVLSEHTVMISAGYSISALANAATADSTAQLPKGMLIDSAIVTIYEEGKGPVTLRKLSPSVFGAAAISFTVGARYTLTVTDCTNGKTATATTTYMANDQDAVVSIKPVGTSADSLISIDLSISAAPGADAYYLVSYSTLAQLRRAAGAIALSAASHSMAALTSFEPKRIQLLSGADAKNGKLCGNFMTKASKNDTVVVQIARVDQAYYRYLTAYKRTGYFINQITGEPINLPSNVQPGFGYFALSLSQRYLFDVATGIAINGRAGHGNDQFEDWPDADF